ncbi:MAG: hypothetical protein JWN48_1737 [Myxococcaceae bacterium]|nr:hypothetical protein [Myxococcaceae bacterium]
MTLPAPPPGYVYMALPQPQLQLQSAGDPRRDQLYAELTRVNLRLETLQDERPSLGGPITFMVVGYGTALVSSLVALGSFSDAEDIHDGRIHSRDHERDLDVNNDGVVDSHDEHQLRRTSRVAAGVGGAGLAVGLFSTIGLFRRIAQRRAQNVELRDLREKSNNLRSQLDFGANSWNGRTQFTVQGQW